MKPQSLDNKNEHYPADTGGCSVCRDLLNSLGRFFDMIQAASPPQRSDWLTVDEISQELKLSKSIIYRLIRNGELEAVDLVVGEDGKMPQKGHFRIRRSALDQYLESKKVKPLSNPPARPPALRFPKVKNHLGL